MDDPEYPGAVLGPKTVPKRTRALLEAGAMTEEDAWVIHAENPRAVYGIDLSYDRKTSLLWFDAPHLGDERFKGRYVRKEGLPPMGGRYVDLRSRNATRPVRWFT